MISIKELYYKYEDNYIFENFNFQFHDNKLYAIKGESGRGKTTLLNLMLGFEIPEKGEIIFDNKILNQKNIFEIRKQSAFIPQDFNVKVDTIKELFFSVFELKINKKKLPDENLIKQQFEKMGLDFELMNKKIDEVSGGQKQRVVLASVLMTNKKYLFLDEPTSALDFESSKKMLQCLKNSNATVIISTHDENVLHSVDEIVDLDLLHKKSI